MKIELTDGLNPDFIALCRLLDESLNEMVGGSVQREQYNRYNRLDDIHDVVLIYQEGEPAACGSFKTYSEGIAEIKRLFVRKEYRGRGFSRKVMEELERKARDAGFAMLYLETGKALKAAHGLYRSLGFTVRENYGPYEKMEESVCMEKALP